MFETIIFEFPSFVAGAIMGGLIFFYTQKRKGSK